jgi:hypothetical protein
MSFNDKLNKTLQKILSESEFDYENDWEKFRQEREKLRQQAAADQRKAADAEANQELQQKINRSGGFSQWFKKDADWEPPEHLVIVNDIETGEGILLPSLQKKGKELYLFIPWALAEVVDPTKTLQGRVDNIFPFCQFEEDKWPSKQDFDWEHSRPRSPSGVPDKHDADPEYYFLHDVTWNKRDQLNDKAALRLFESDKNHYHMLRGDDKAIVDHIVQEAVEEWFRENQEIADYDDMYES